MSDEIDPEVLADLQLRASSQYDSTRTRGAGVYDWKKPNDVAQWPCKRAKCRKPVGVTQEAVDRFEDMNRILGNMMPPEPRATIGEVVFCDECAAAMARTMIDLNVEKRSKLADVIRAMKESANPRAEHDLIKKLNRLDHPDVTGLIESLAAKLETGKNAKVKGKKL